MEVVAIEDDDFGFVDPCFCTNSHVPHISTLMSTFVVVQYVYASYSYFMPSPSDLLSSWRKKWNYHGPGNP